MDLDGTLAKLIELGGSDVHLKVNSPPMGRVDGELVPLDERLLTESDLEAILTRITERIPAKREHFYAAGDLDTAYLAEGLGRFRVNAYRQRGSIAFAFRFIPREIPSFEQLGLPPGVQRLSEVHRGLVLVTGATGSGKSTTLASMVNSINRSRKHHIITLEDPIEFVHDDWGCIVSQREISLDTESYREGLRRVLRQDPDVILIGELRDEESAHSALQAAESGHLVFSTLHTLDAAETVARLIEFFPAEKQLMIRQVLAGVLEGVISQRLLPKVGGGRVAAVEVNGGEVRLTPVIGFTNVARGLDAEGVQTRAWDATMHAADQLDLHAKRWTRRLEVATSQGPGNRCVRWLDRRRTPFQVIAQQLACLGVPLLLYWLLDRAGVDITGTVYLAVVVWWAIRAEPTPGDGQEPVRALAPLTDLNHDLFAKLDLT